MIVRERTFKISAVSELDLVLEKFSTEGCLVKVNSDLKNKSIGSETAKSKKLYDTFQKMSLLTNITIELLDGIDVAIEDKVKSLNLAITG